MHCTKVSRKSHADFNKLDHKLLVYDPTKQNGHVSEEVDTRPAIVISTQEHKVIDKAVAAITAEYPATDTGNAERLVARHGERIRYCKPWSKWLSYDGQRWAVDQTSTIQRLAKDTVRRILDEARTIGDDGRRKAHALFGFKSEARDRRAAMIDLAASEDGIPVLPEQMDKNGWLLNVQNGTIDLRTGKLRPHSQGDMITALSPVAFDPATPCPLWLQCLDKIFAGNAELIDFMRRLFGLCLTGEISEQILPICYGTGSNGKTTILNVMLEILGNDYGIIAPPGLLIAKHGESHPTERAMLFGKRFVVDVETAEGARLNENLVKQLTGSDMITARRMREDFWSFLPTHKVMLCTNHKPEVRETKNAIWRRIKLIPFSVAIPEAEQNKELPRLLQAEYPGILAWCVQGCLDWQRDGLKVPQTVSAATQNYRTESDAYGTFLAEHCMQGPGLRVKASPLYEAFKKWAERSGENVTSQRAFGFVMTEHGFERITNNGTWYLGIGLRSEADHGCVSRIDI